MLLDMDMYIAPESKKSTLRKWQLPHLPKKSALLLLLVIALPVLTLLTLKQTRIGSFASEANKSEAEEGINKTAQVYVGTNDPSASHNSYIQFGGQAPGSVSTNDTQLTTPSGWNYNLTKKCVKSTDPSKQNGFSDTSECDSSGKQWTIANQSEKAGENGQSCPGPVVQSFPYNTSDSPLRMDWTPHTDERGQKNWQVNLKTDFRTKTHPCGAGYYTWFVLMDHIAHNGGPLPKAAKTVVKARVKFHKEGQNGSSRMFVGWQGTLSTGKNYQIEIDLYQDTNWGDGAPNDYLTVVIVYNNGNTRFAEINGREYGMEIPLDVEKDITVDFEKITNDLVAHGTFDVPPGGWANLPTDTVYIGKEDQNKAASDSVVSDLSITNLRIEQKL